MFKSSKNSRSEKGQSLLELAISLVLILTLLAGAVDFGLAFFSWVAIRDASQEGAIYGAVCPNSDAAIETRVRSVSNTPVDLTDEDRVNVDIFADDISPGKPIEVMVEFDYESLTPGLSAFIGTDGIVTIRASTTNTILTTTDSSCP